MKWIAVFLAIAVMSMPAALAEASAYGSAQTSTEASAEVTSATDLRVKQLSQGISDLVYRIKAAFTFSQEAKLQLLKERNEQMRERQEAWLQMKADIMTNSTSEAEKREMLLVVQDEHEFIVAEHLRLTAEMRALHSSAADARIKAEAETEAEAMEESGLGAGLGITASSSAKISLPAPAAVKG